MYYFCISQDITGNIVFPPLPSMNMVKVSFTLDLPIGKYEIKYDKYKCFLKNLSR